MMRLMPRPFIAIGGRCVPAFRACGYAGLLLALAAATVLGASRHLSVWFVLAMALAALATFFALAWSVKMLTGTEKLVYYHHQIAILALCGLLLRATGRPLLRYLDVVVVGIGVFLACGRIGCLLTGCCHGRVCGWGVCYGGTQQAGGFPILYAGLPLLPVQALESLWVLGLSGTCFLAALVKPAAGEALSLYLIGYGAGRFYLETLRGDPQRPRLWGVTEAQWTALCLAMVVSWAEWHGWLPPHASHYVTACLLSLSAAVLALGHLFRPGHHLLDAWHVWEIAGAVDGVIGPQNDAIIRETSRGLRISGGFVSDGGRDLQMVAFSRQNAPLDQRSVVGLAQLIGTLVSRRYPDAAWKLLDSGNGVFYIVTHLASEPVPLPRFLQSTLSQDPSAVTRSLF